MFNVPCGHNPTVAYYDAQNIAEVSVQLHNVDIQVFGFEDDLINMKPKDLVFLDPRYDQEKDDIFKKALQTLFEGLFLIWSLSRWSKWGAAKAGRR